MYEFLNSLNWAELIIGAILGALIGFFIALLWDSYIICKKNKLEKSKYSFLVDNYISKYENGTLKAEAEITYIKDNILKITVKHDTRTWKGTILMSTTEFGNVSFSYSDEPENVGMKLLVLSADCNSFTLIPEIYYMISKELKFDKEVYRRIQ